MDLISSFSSPVERLSRSIFRRSGKRPPRILLLTSNLGAGHERAAFAIERSLWQQVPECQTETIDFWSLMDPGVAAALQSTYLALVTGHPQLYQQIYQMDQHFWRSILEAGESPPALLHHLHALVREPVKLPASAGFLFDRVLFRQLLTILAPIGNSMEKRLTRLFRQQAIAASWHLLASRLCREIRRFKPDVILATQVNMGALAANLKRHRLTRAHLMGVVTDFGVHDFWSQRNIDSYCVADALLQPAAMEKFRENAAIEVTGMPLMPAFTDLPDAEEARRMLGIAPTRPVVLVLGGGLGLCMAEVIRQLAARFASRCDAPLLLVLGGRNPVLHSELSVDPVSAAALTNGGIQIQGWTDRVSVFMRAADMVVGKPGGLSTAEVLACGRPLFSTRCLGGQESFNVSYLEHYGVGGLLTDSQLCNKVCTLLDDRAGIRVLQERAWAVGKREGASAIAAHALRFAGANRPVAVSAFA
jgi:processive 1,2-diacylglycerol beta-glucosyltransferase